MKRLHNKIIHTSLLFMILTTLFMNTVAGAALQLPVDISESKQREAISILLQLQIMSVKEDGFFYEDELVSRSEFSNMISKISGIPTSDISEANMSTSLAIEKLLDLLGYGAVAKIRGYNNLAIQLELTSKEKYLTRAEAARLIYAALRTKMMEVVESVGTNVKYSNKNSETLIETYMNMTFVKGRIEANGISAIKPYSIPGENRIILNGQTYLDNIGADQEVGRTVIAAVSKEQSDTQEIYALTPEYTHYEDTVINAADLVFDQTKNGKICYENSSGSIVSKSFSGDVAVVYNGEVLNSYSDSDFRIANGNIVLAYSKNGTVEAVYINEYTTHIANGSNKYEMTVFFKDGEAPLQIDKDSEHITVYVDGAVGTIGDISEFDAVDIYKGKYSDKITLKVTTKRVLGLCNYINDDEIEIDGKAYERCKTTNYGIEDADFGEKHSFILNSEGLVCGVDNTVKEVGNYGYLFNVSGDRSLPENGIKVRILNIDNELERYELVDRVKVNDKRYKLKDFFKSSNPLLFEDGVKRQIIRYEMNDEGKITEIYTSQDNTDSQNPNAQLRLDARSKQPTRMYRNTFGINYRFSGQTRVLIMPPDGSEDEKDYCFTTVSDWGEDHTFDNYEIYNTKRSRDIGLFVTYEAVKEEGYSVAKQKSDIVLVAENVRVFNEDKPECYQLTYYEGGVEKTAVFEDSDVCNKYPNAWSQYPKTLKAEDVKAGDILQLVLNARGEITEFHMLYRIEDGETAYSEALPTGYSYTAQSVPLSYLYTAFGEIADVYGGTITVDVNNTTDPDNLLYNRNFKIESLTSFLLYERGAIPKISKISSDEVMLGDKVFVRAYNYIPYNVIVIR